MHSNAADEAQVALDDADDLSADGRAKSPSQASDIHGLHRPTTRRIHDDTRALSVR